MVKRALCRPPGQNHACSPRESAKKPRWRTSWCDFLKLFIIQHDFYENYVKLSENSEISQNFMKISKLSPHGQNNSNSYGILGVLGSGNVKMLILGLSNHFHKNIFSQIYTFSLFSLFHFWAAASL